MIELQRAAVLDPLVERGDRAPKDARADAEAAMRGEELQVHAGTGPELTRTLDQRTAGAEIDERHGVPWTQDRVSPGDGRLAEARVEAPLG